ncbi:3-dehydroquinate synthase [Candidatus Dojkabacteria bacterium]|nr:3-dehydroquinate synthase [Candidatus Dojkabacteria bacterium]
MKKLSVNIKTELKNYPIMVGQDLFGKMSKLVNLSKYSSIFLITDTNVDIYSSKLDIPKNLIKAKYIFEAGEKAKSLQTVEKILTMLADNNADRKSLAINLGGGVATDLGGLVASLYQRGMDFLNISTTIEGMVDASVGGKTGVNLGNNKNYVGTFSQPIAVIIDVDTLDTLDDRNFIAGWAEVIKHGLIRDSQYFKFVVAKHIRKYSKAELVDIIARSCEIKAQVVENDEKEGGLRKILNFGHTIGHAIESLSFDTNYPLLHGEAIAIGMIAEAYISLRLGKVTQQEFNEIQKGIQNVGLPIGIEDLEISQIQKLILKDKKNDAGVIKWTLLNSIGKCEFDVIVEDMNIVDEAIRHILLP